MKDIDSLRRNFVMMTLVIGGSGSGKSAYAEKITAQLGGQSKKYYLATMEAYDKEAQQKVERHRRLRRGKGFLTIEQPTKIQEALEKMEAGNRIALLECVSNLTANEMFTEGKEETETQVVQRVIQGVTLLKEQTTHLVVVSNHVFEDGVTYDEAVMAYIRAMGRINQTLATLAERVVEVVVGIPIVVKQ